MNRQGNLVQINSSTYPLRPQRKGLKRLIGRLVTALLFLLLLWLFFNVLRVEIVQVSGLQLVERDELMDAVGIEPGMSIFLVNSGRAAERIRKLPPVKEATVHKELPSTVRITLTERTPEAYILAQQCYWAVDGDGMVFYRVDHYDGNLPVITGVSDDEIVPGRTIRCPAKGQALKIFLTELSRVQLEVAELNIAEADDLILYTMEGLEVRLGKSEDMGKKLSLLQESQPYLDLENSSYIDVRSGLRLVVVRNE